MLSDLPLLIYAFTVGFVPAAAVLRYYFRRQKNDGFPVSGLTQGMLYLFGLYLIAVFQVTGCGSFWQLFRYGFQNGRLNLIPFSHGFDLQHAFLNVLLFVPLGLLLSALFSHQRKPSRVVLLGLGLSLLIELSQIFSGRATDVDDLIFNTLGALLGLYCYRLNVYLIRDRHHMQKVPVTCYFLLVMTIFLSRFFLYNDLGFLNLIHS